jgi:GNAT superfamily N-acetyltransferase
VCGVDLTWLDPEALDGRDVAAAVALLQAARVVDAPHRLGETASSFTARLRHGSDGDRPVTALARDAQGRPVGLLSLLVPRRENTHLGWMVVTIDPLRRREGLGRRLFEEGVARVRADGRTVLLGHGFDSPGLGGFAAAMGMEPVLTVAHRRQDLRTADRTLFDREYATAEQRAEPYELVRIAGRTPEEMLPAVVAMTAAINDAPTGDLDVEDLVISGERVRAYEAAQAALGNRLYRLVARHRATGELAGHTVMGVEEQRPWYGSQHDTSVVRAHRGHRLGLLLKIGMLRWLAEVEPQLHTLDTSNASSNSNMIRINDMLGYHVIATSTNWQRHL